MASGQGKNKNTTYFSIAMDTNALSAGIKQVMSMFSKMVRSVNSSLSKLGNINNQAFNIQSSRAKQKYGFGNNVSAERGRDTRTVEQFNQQERAAKIEKEEELTKKLREVATYSEKGGWRARPGFAKEKKERLADLLALKLAYEKQEEEFLLSRPYNKTQVFDTGARKGTKQTQSESWGTGFFYKNSRGKDIELMAGKDIILETYHDVKKNIDVIKQKTIEWQDIETNIGIQRIKTNETITDNIEEQEKKQSGFFGTLFKRFKSVAIYRAIRNFLKVLVESIKQTIEGITSVNSGFKDTMSNITSSVNMLKASGAVALYGLLELAEPLVRLLAQGVAYLANAISKLVAKLTKSAEYTKINLDYMQEFKSAMNGSLLSFDTFTKMSSGSGVDYNKMLETVENPAKHLPSIVDTFQRILDVSSSIVDQIKGAWETVKGVADILAGVFTLDFDLISQGLNRLLDGFKLLGQGILNMFISIGAAIVNTGIRMINMTLKPVNWIARLFGADENFAQIAEVEFPLLSFATGGSYARGDVFRANEFGKTELVASSSSGGAVMNMQQLESAVHNGVASAMSSGGKGDAVIMLDGNKVGTYIAGNAGFRATANKRNTGLNWR